MQFGTKNDVFRNAFFLCFALPFCHFFHSPPPSCSFYCFFIMSLSSLYSCLSSLHSPSSFASLAETSKRRRLSGFWSAFDALSGGDSLAFFSSFVTSKRGQSLLSDYLISINFFLPSLLQEIASLYSSAPNQHKHLFLSLLSLVPPQMRSRLSIKLDSKSLKNARLRGADALGASLFNASATAAKRSTKKHKKRRKTRRKSKSLCFHEVK